MSPTPRSSLEALLVDPALFAAPYDLALTRGLESADVRVRWASRPPRAGEVDELAQVRIEPLFYRGVQASAKAAGALAKARKAASHVLGGLRLLRLARSGGFDIVHFQWSIIPLYDGLLMRRLDRRIPVIMTVHDLVAFNGDPTSRLQSAGYAGALRAARRLIVHTASARETLIARGHDPRRVVTIPHGPLTLGAAPESGVAPRGARTPGTPWRVVLFGKLQPYKGVDVLIEALGRLSPEVRARLSVIVAGEPLTPTEPLLARAAALDLGQTLSFRLERQSEAQMAELFAEADAFVFPYRQIEASGVLHLVWPYGRWIVASDLGAFREVIIPEANGARVPPGDPGALARALADSIGRAPTGEGADALPGWDEIGRRTRAVYEDAIAELAAERRA